MTSITAHSGIVRLTRKDLEKLRAEQQRVTINMTGLLILSGDVPPQLAEETIGRLHIRGIIRAPREVKQVLQKKKT